MQPAGLYFSSASVEQVQEPSAARVQVTVLPAIAVAALPPKVPTIEAVLSSFMVTVGMAVIKFDLVAPNWQLPAASPGVVRPFNIQVSTTVFSEPVSPTTRVTCELAI